MKNNYGMRVIVYWVACAVTGLMTGLALRKACDALFKEIVLKKN